MEEVELGGLEDEEDKRNNIGFSGIDEEFRPSYSGDKFEVCYGFFFLTFLICSICLLQVPIDEDKKALK